MSKHFTHLNNYYTEQKPNGALLYSKEIVKYFIPTIKTTRNWVTIRVVPHAFNHSIVFIHNNLNPWFYDYLTNYEDLVLVCGIRETCDKVKHLGKTIYLPLSVDVEEVEKYKTTKTKEICYAGRKGKYASCNVHLSTPHLQDLEHEELLRQMAEYKKVYAVGRTAIEAKILGCEILPYDPRYPDTNLWQILDSKDAAKMLQKELDKIDGKVTKCRKQHLIKKTTTNY